MIEGPRLHQADETAPEPAVPIGPFWPGGVSRPKPHYVLVVLPLNEADDPEEVKTYEKCLAAITDCDALAVDPDRLERLRLAVRNPAWIVVYDAAGNEVRRWPVLRLVPDSRSVSWWANLFRRW